MPLIVVNKTYRGKYGLFLAGHPCTLPETIINQIDAELMMHNPPEKFDYRIVENPEEINKTAASADDPPATVRIRIKKTYNGKLGHFKGGQIVDVLPDQLEDFEDEKIDYEKIEPKTPEK